MRFSEAEVAQLDEAANDAPDIVVVEVVDIVVRLDTRYTFDSRVRYDCKVTSSVDHLEGHRLQPFC
jgi:hypothetical protein